MKQKKCRFCIYGKSHDVSICGEGNKKDSRLCSRGKDHKGLHIACYDGQDGHDLARWD